MRDVSYSVAILINRSKFKLKIMSTNPAHSPSFQKHHNFGILKNIKRLIAMIKGATSSIYIKNASP